MGRGGLCLLDAVVQGKPEGGDGRVGEALIGSEAVKGGGLRNMWYTEAVGDAGQFPGAQNAPCMRRPLRTQSWLSRSPALRAGLV